VLVVYVTAPNADVAGSIAEQLVGSKLVACVNILPGITSIYTWKVGSSLAYSTCFQLHEGWEGWWAASWSIV
jgi:uncharacterized protein involved in tolerance to divalent cations